MRLCVKKIISLILIISISMCIMSSYTYISRATGLSKGEEDFGKNVEDEVEENTQDALDKVSDSIIGVARVISYTIAIVTLMVLGIRYMTSAPGDRADIKKHAVIYFVGAFILFALPTIIEILINLSENFSK